MILQPSLSLLSPKLPYILSVPTGHIAILQGEKGLLECLSLGDYGKEANIKADFMGLTKEINGVEHKELLPLEKKWVATISTQYGCSMNCKFCDVPKVGPGKNVTIEDLTSQLLLIRLLHPEVTSTKRLNIHFARMGEPTWNPAVLVFAEEVLPTLFLNFHIHPVVSTMAPRKNRLLNHFLGTWLDIKNIVYQGEAGLQLSINSTSEEERAFLFSENALPLKALSDMFRNYPSPQGRKITLNFALAGYQIDASYLASLFSPEWFMCKLTPMHMTNACKDSNIRTDGGYEYFSPYKEAEDNLKAEGYDVIVFIPSKEEDESCITCGNALLSLKE